jgi:hypothetical protein
VTLTLTLTLTLALTLALALALALTLTPSSDTDPSPCSIPGSYYPGQVTDCAALVAAACMALECCSLHHVVLQPLSPSVAAPIT